MSIGDSRDYDVSVRAMEQIADAQSYASRRDVRNVCSDCLVKAPVPCFISVDATITVPPGSPDVNTTAIAAAVSDVVNGIGFTGRLPVSKLMNTMHGYIPSGAAVDSVSVLGELQQPNGVTLMLHANDILQVPDDPANMTTSRTIAFYLVPNDVSVTVQVAAIAAV